MTYLLPLLFLPLFAQAQTISFHEGAGLNPRHIESLGPDYGWVELWVGPMAIDGQVLKIVVERWDEVEKIEVRSFFVKYSQGAINPTSIEKQQWIGFQVRGVEQGDFIRFEYTVKRKKA